MQQVRIVFICSGAMEDEILHADLTGVTTSKDSRSGQKRLKMIHSIIVREAEVCIIAEARDEDKPQPKVEAAPAPIVETAPAWAGTDSVKACLATASPTTRHQEAIAAEEDHPF